MTDAFQPLTGRTLRTSVTDTIRQAILEGGLMPGEQVNQAHIAEKLGISRGPVREALGQLEQEGLIRNIPYKGTFVTEITPEYIEELYSMREVLEAFAIRRAVTQMTSEDLAELRSTVAAMKQAADLEDAVRLGQLDVHFHGVICQSAHHQLLMQTWRALDVGVRRCLVLRHRIYNTPREIVGTHPDILAALEAGNADLASSLLIAHIHEAGEQLIKVWTASQEAAAEAESAPVEVEPVEVSV